MRIAIVDYGMGNIHSIIGALNYLRAGEVAVTSDSSALEASDKLILPGVGAFGKAMANLRERGLDGLLNKLVKAEKKPILGICLGMQLMGVSSDENGPTQGLGFVPGTVSRFDDSQVRVPHVGINQVEIAPGLKLYKGLPARADFYFTHSYRMTSDSAINQCACSYGGDFVASYEIGNVAGVQFHPELSQRNGLTLLKNFITEF